MRRTFAMLFGLGSPVFFLSLIAVSATGTGCKSPSRGDSGQSRPTPEVVSVPGSPSEPRKVPEALRELEEKLKPPNLPPSQPETPPTQPAPAGPPPLPLAQEELQRKAEETIGTFVKALREGDRARAEALLLSEEQLTDTVSPGFRSQIGVDMVLRTRELVGKLVDRLGGKAVRHQWKPGTVSVVGENAFFLKGVTVLSNGRISLEADGMRIEVQADQLVWLGDQWKIFRLTIP